MINFILKFIPKYGLYVVSPGAKPYMNNPLCLCDKTC